MFKKRGNKYLHEYTDPAPLAVFRIFFGILMFVSLLRFYLKGWLETTYINPSFHFKYYGFEWVESLGEWNYLIFIICALSSILIALGYKYQLSIIVFFLSFTYIELIDVASYLNHYYFISILSFLLIFLPANAKFSIDNLINSRCYQNVPKWTIDSVKLLIAIVYIYAGIAKINSDWLLNALPLSIWLTPKYDLPLIGPFLEKEWVHYTMSWGSMLYDIVIVFLLLSKKTRVIGFCLVLFFHIATAVLFPVIGMFPYIMIFGSIIFFDNKIHNRILSIFSFVINKRNYLIKSNNNYYNIKHQKIKISLLIIFFIFQIAMPFRYLLYPGELFWHEQGYRFSWRVMLVEKVGYTSFSIYDAKTQKKITVVDDHSKFLSPIQIKQMSFQPDLILQYAHMLGDHFKERNGNNNVNVYVDCFVTLNGRRSQRLINPETDLYNQKESFKPKEWILPLRDEINGI